MRADKRIAVGDALNRALEVRRDCLAEQRISTRPVSVGQHLFGYTVSGSMTVLREDLLQGTSVVLAGGVPAAVRATLGRVGADLQELDSQSEEDAAEAWARARAPLGALVFDGRPAFGSGGMQALALVLERAWIAVRAVAVGALIPAGTGKIVLVAPSLTAGLHAAAARGGLESLARTLSIEWARYGVSTAAVMPGEQTGDEQLGELVCFLVSGAADYLSGSRLDLGNVSPADRH